MNKDSNSTSPLPDELLYSVLLRNAFANGLHLLVFLNILVNKEALTSLNPSIYDARIDPAVILDSFGWRYDPVEFYLRHSMFCGFAPFQRYSETSHDVAMFNNRPELGLTPRNSFITNVRFCPKCIEEDTVAYGMYYMHRSHQMPGARTCWRHSVPLFTYSGPIGNELNGNIVPTAQEIVSDDTSYAVFAKDLLDKMYSISIREIKEAIRSKAMDLYHCDWDKLAYQQPAADYNRKTIDTYGPYERMVAVNGIRRFRVHLAFHDMLESRFGAILLVLQGRAAEDGSERCIAGFHQVRPQGQTFSIETFVI